MSSPDDIDPAAPDSNLPTVWGYEILEVIASSGLTTIYRARDVWLGQEVAIKIHQPGVNPERLLWEAKITARFAHPGIVPLYQADQLSDGRVYMAMKLVKGDTLAHILRDRASPFDNLPQLVAALEQVCQALAYAHSHGVIHRNLKPSKVMIGAFGEVQVLGWGLARVTAPNEPPASTGSQNILGTPAYMPPEQARGEVADARADVFGLGGLLCAILTGEPPFVGPGAMELIRRSAAGDLAECFARLDACGAEAELIALAKRCLAPNPADRAADAGEVARAVAELQVVVEERTRQAELDRRAAEVRAAERRLRHRRSLLMFVFLIAAVVLLLANAVLLWSNR